MTQTTMVIQCVLGAILGLLLHFLKKAKESERTTGVKVRLHAYIAQDPKEAMISVLLAVILIIGVPEMTEVAHQMAQQMFNLQLPALQRTFFVSALLGGFGNSFADIVGSYFGGERLAKFVSRS